MTSFLKNFLQIDKIVCVLGHYQSYTIWLHFIMMFVFMRTQLRHPNEKLNNKTA